MILCCQVTTRAAGTAWVSALPVTQDDLGQFVRSGAYFDPGHWPDGCFAGAGGGDAVLARIGYRWTRRHAPADGFTWAEATAYCTSRSGRLPWFEESRDAGAAVARLGTTDTRRLAALLPVELRDAGRLPHGRPEWCGDWYNAAATGPGVRAEAPLRRRLTAEPWCLVPAASHMRVGFRVAFGTVLTACGSAVAGWEWIEPPSAEIPGSEAGHRVEAVPRQRRMS